MRSFIMSLSAVFVVFLSYNLMAEQNCSYFAGESECQSSGYCSWDPGKQMCQGGFQASARACEEITCPCKCKPARGCKWDAAAKRCGPLG